MKETLRGLAAIGKILGFIEKLAIAVVMATLEFARLKRKKAEDHKAVAESEVKVLTKEVEIDNQIKGKPPADIIDSYLK